MEAQIRYTQTADGVSIAYAVVGQGPPLLFARQLISPGIDDELARPSGIWPSLTDSHSVVLWDLRGEGLSGSAPESGFDGWVADLEAVADAAAAERVDLVGVLSHCHVAMAYAARRQDRVNRFALYVPMPPRNVPHAPPWLLPLATENWSEFVDICGFRVFGWERADAGRRWADRIRAHFTATQYLHRLEIVDAMDASDVAALITAPTLVVDDRNLTTLFAEPLTPFARQLAATIPAAQLAVINPGDARDATAQVIERFLSGSDVLPARPSAATASGTAVILFTDIVSSTELTERMGDVWFRDASRALDAALRAAIGDAGGTAIDGKLLGDGVLATFPSAAQAIDGARRCLALSAASELGLHIGLHAGDVIREENNVFGGAVNIASRICGLSAPGEILVSDVVRGMARSSAGVTFEDRGEQEMKGVGEPVRVYAVRGQP